MHILKNIAKSFFSKPLYQEVATTWKGVGFRYLFVVVVLVSIPVVFQMAIGLNYVYEYLVDDALLDQIPAITISKGELSIDKPSPHVIRDPHDGGPMIMFDTSAAQNARLEPGIVALVTSHSVLVAKSEYETRTFHIPEEADDFFVDKTMIKGWMMTLKKWAPYVVNPLLGVCVVVFSFIVRIIQVLIYAVFGLLIAALLKVKLSYGQLVRLTVVSLTPSIIVALIVSLFEIPLPAQGLVFFSMATGYLTFAIIANRESALPS